ncbi:hypothetical protein F5148DRAFT_1012019 [Russula earlei]|uniref:Uncharacterized protein n=1 Tax=Russula earlei TaxID=71964 RepID=A0ACC0UD34_9AGAM|nr:hypothetical protein F5148DRAFT_1012019 [Russula earlei]
MSRSKAVSGQLKQQTLIGFLKPSSSKNSSLRDDRSRTNKHAVRVSSQFEFSEPSDQSDTDDGVDTIHFEPRREATSGDDDDIQPSSPTKRRRTVADVESPAAPGNGTSLSSDSDESMGSHRRVRSSTKLQRAVSRSPSTEPEPESPPKRRRLARGVRPSSPEESDDLLGEVDEADIIQSRFRDRRGRTAFQMKLDKLKKKKLGAKLSESIDEETSEADDPIVPFEGSQQDDSDRDGDNHGGEDSDNDIDDFVVQDDEAVIPDLPMAFSRHSHQDVRHDFKVVCQLFVHLAMTPMDERKTYMAEKLNGEPYFSVPFQVVNRKISGTLDSIASSVWRRDYREKLERYPDLTMTRLDFAVPHCDACHLGGRQSTRVGYLKGIPYDKLSFEPIIDESDSEDCEDEISCVTSLTLGRFCAARTQVFHRLSHWKYHLFRTLSEEVDLVQQPRKKRPYNRLAYAKNLPPPEDTSDPDDVMEWLDRRGTVSAEWQRLNEVLERASTLDAHVGKKEDDIDLDL